LNGVYVQCKTKTWINNKGGDGGDGQGYGQSNGIGANGIGGGGKGGNGGTWGQAGQAGTNGNAKNAGIAGTGGCWVNGSEYLTIKSLNIELGGACTSSNQVVQIPKPKPPVLVPTYNLTRSVSNVDEGSTVTFTLNTTNVANGTLIPYSISGVTSQDINGANSLGNFTINNNTASLILNIATDTLVEDTETLVLTTVENLSASVVINDIVNITISSDTNNYNSVNTFLTSNGWKGVKKVNLIITVNSGVTVGSTSESNPALTIPALPTGSKVTLINYGNIYGAGGSGGSGTTGNGANGSDGGTAISSGTPITLNNYGNIKGGGGGGGGGGGYSTKSTSCSWGGCYGVGLDSCDKDKCNSAPDCWAGWSTGGSCQTGTCTAGTGANNYCRRGEHDGKQCWSDRRCTWHYQQTCNCTTTGDDYNGGNGGRGQGSGNLSGSGTTGGSTTIGGNGGAFGTDGSNGGNYSATVTGGNFGLAGYYLKLLSDATYVINAQSGSSVAGRVG
jgi:hypothetical protein